MTGPVTPSLYDLLDVDPGASDAEIRAAWKAAIADLDPTDRRFRAYNQAAEVLLDPERRRAHDAELAESAEEPAEEPAPAQVSPTPSVPVTHQPAPESTGPLPAYLSGAVLAVVAVLTAALVVLTVIAWTRPHPAPEGVVKGLVEAVSSDEEQAAREAQVAAERAIVPILSYDYRHLDENRAAAGPLMTDDYRKEYDRLFAVIEENAPDTETVVSVEVVASGIARAGTERAEILVFLDQPTTNARNEKPVVFRNQVRVQVEKVGDDWLVDCLITTPDGRCD